MYFGKKIYIKNHAFVWTYMKKKKKTEEKKFNTHFNAAINSSNTHMHIKMTHKKTTYLSQIIYPGLSNCFNYY